VNRSRNGSDDSAAASTKRAASITTTEQLRQQKDSLMALNLVARADVRSAGRRARQVTIQGDDGRRPDTPAHSLETHTEIYSSFHIRRLIVNPQLTSRLAS